MSPWTEADAATFRDIADVAVPRREEMRETLLRLVPFDSTQVFRVIELGAGDGTLAASILERFPKATLMALDGSATMREAARARTSLFADRIIIRQFDLATLDWWDVMHGAGIVVASLALHHLNDAKKQFLFKAVAERLAPGGAFLVADLVAPATDVSRRMAAEAWDAAARSQSSSTGKPGPLDVFLTEQWNQFSFPDDEGRPSELFHQLMWLKHAGFPRVDCAWLFAGHAVFGGFK